ncbi:MAG: cytochrome P450 [Flavobacteriaceae bacterium]|nr:cytochrome P450 [Flavobacteriaceae bacterium]|tara:strand:+ start:10225 stop:11556 length:1332 start_codon:yes stop_codon:yes gene_type:complete
MATTNIPSVSFVRFLKHSFKILKNPLPFHHNNFERLGDTFQLTIGWNKKVVFSRDAAFLQYVLQKNHRNYTKSEIQTKDLSKYVGKGLLTSEGAHWKQQRKLIQPGFHKKQLVTLLETMNQTISEELKNIKTNQPFNVFSVFNDLAFQVVAKSLFSGAVRAEEINRLQEITEAAQKMLVRELRQPYLRSWFRWSGTLEKHTNLVQEARTLLQKIVYDRRNSGQREDDLLDMLLDARYEDGSAMEDTQLIDEILILFVAGHETTSNALTFTCELLARNPVYQEKILSELPDQMTKESLGFLIREATWIPMVIEETMRLYPPAYFIDRVNLDDDQYKQMQFDAGTSLLFSVYEIHRHPKLWENPLAFQPERFEKRTSNEHSGHYFPFGAGPRMCIGNNFAMYEMIMTVAQLMKQFRIEPTSKPIEIEPLITLKPKNAMLVFQKRK